jgi:hypothetical protein
VDPKHLGKGDAQPGCVCFTPRRPSHRKEEGREDPTPRTEARSLSVIEGRKAAVVDGLRGGEVVKTGSPRPMLLAEEKGRRVEGRRRRGGEG